MTEYGTTYGVQADDNCRIVVRFDKVRGALDRFVVQLQLQKAPETWTTIAQIDHAPRDNNGHDLFVEGVHVDIYRQNGRQLKLHPDHAGLPRKPGEVLRVCTDYLKNHVGWYRKVHEGTIEPKGPPRL